MATLGQLITRIEIRLSLAAGEDVQTHAEDRIVEMIRNHYELLVDEARWAIPKYLITVPIVNGIPTTDLTNIIHNYIDIEVMFLGERDSPLPELSHGVNPKNINAICYTASHIPTTVFTLYPLTTNDEVHIWYQDILPDAVWEDNLVETEIPIKAQLIILKVCADYLADDGSNDEAQANFMRDYLKLYNTLKTAHQDKPMAKRSQANSGTRTRWE